MSISADHLLHCLLNGIIEADKPEILLMRFWTFLMSQIREKGFIVVADELHAEYSIALVNGFGPRYHKLAWDSNNKAMQEEAAHTQ